MGVLVGVRIRGRRIDQVQMLFQLGEPGSRTSREPAGVWVLRLEAFTMATRPRCLERATAARTCWQNTSAVRPGATRPPSQPSRQSTRPKPETDADYPQALRPGVAHVAPCDTRHASASDGKPPASHLADTDPLAAAERARLQGRREADSTDQPQPDHARVEVRGRWSRLTEPLPAGVSHVIGFLLGFTPQRPGGAFADVVMGM